MQGFPHPIRLLVARPLPELSSASQHLTPCRCRADSPHMRQSRPDVGLGFQVKVLNPFEIGLFSLGRGGLLTLISKPKPGTVLDVDPALNPRTLKHRP